MFEPFPDPTPQAHDAGVTLSFGVYPDTPELTMANYRLRADPNKLGQVIRNLVSNSIKFTPRNGVVTVELELVDGGAVGPVRLKAGGSSVTSLSRDGVVLGSQSEPTYQKELYNDVFLRVSVKDTGSGMKVVGVGEGLCC